jgi:hypothetical protein
VNWLLISIVASVILTIVLNVALRAFPGAGARTARRMETWAAPAPEDRYDPRARRSPRPRVRVLFPWKAMLIGSVVLTLLLNVVIRLG